MEMIYDTITRKANKIAIDKRSSAKFFHTNTHTHAIL